MKRLAFALLAAVALPAEGDAPLFPPVDGLEPALKMPEGARFEIGPDGTFLLDGKPRFLLGTIFYLSFSDSNPLRPGPGYAPEFSWIYESPPTRDYLQRLGFDTVGGEVSTSWMRAYRPEPGFSAPNAWSTGRSP